MPESPQERLIRLRRIAELRSGVSAPENRSSIASDVLTAGPKTAEDFTMGERALGAIEATLGLGSEVLAGIPNLTFGGAMAMGDAALRQASGFGDATGRSAEIVEESAFVPTYEPSTEAGKQTLQSASALISWPFEQVEKLANTIQDKQIEIARRKSEDSGEEFIPPSAGLPTGVLVLPDIIAALTGVEGARLVGRGADVKRVKDQANELGIDLDAPYETQVDQVAAAGEKGAGTGSEGILDIPEGVRTQRTAERERIGGIFAEGREGAAQLPSSEVLQLGSRMEDRLKNMTTSDLPTVARVLKDAKALPLPDTWGDLFNKSWSETPLNDIMELRMSINKDLPSDVTSREYKALSDMKGETDAFLQEAFDQDMLNGSPQALERWREGFSEWSEFKDLFDDDRTMRKIWQDELNAEQVKRLIFNKNAVNAGANAGSLVGDLKKILGADSTQINTLRMTVLEDLMRPITRRDTDLNGFARQWDDFKKNNGTLVKELFPEELTKEMDSMADFAYAIDKTMPIEAQKGLSLPRVISVFTLGHQLARAAAKRAFGEKIAAKVLDPSRENILMSEILGYNPRASVIPRSSNYGVAAVEAFREEE